MKTNYASILAPHPASVHFLCSLPIPCFYGQWANGNLPPILAKRRSNEGVEILSFHGRMVEWLQMRWVSGCNFNRIDCLGGFNNQQSKSPFSLSDPADAFCFAFQLPKLAAALQSHELGNRRGCLFWLCLWGCPLHLWRIWKEQNEQITNHVPTLFEARANFFSTTNTILFQCSLITPWSGGCSL